MRCSSNSDNFYTFVWLNYNGLGSGLALFKHVNGNASQVGADRHQPQRDLRGPDCGGIGRARDRGAGTTITGSFNGVAAITANDPDITAAGSGGLYLYSGANDDGSGIQAEEFYVNDPAAPDAHDPPRRRRRHAHADADAHPTRRHATPTPTPTPPRSVTSVGSLVLAVQLG